MRVPGDPDAVARQRLLILTLAGVAGVALMMFGVLVWRTDLLREGGWPLIGIPLVVAGFIDAFFLPKVLAARWRTPKDL